MNFYYENVVVSEKKNNVVMFGDENTKSIITGGQNKVDNPNLKTFQIKIFCNDQKYFDLL